MRAPGPAHAAPVPLAGGFSVTLYTTAFNEDDGPSVSIDGFCELEDFSLATYHKLKKLGLAPGRCASPDYPGPCASPPRHGASGTRKWPSCKKIRRKC